MPFRSLDISSGATAVLVVILIASVTLGVVFATGLVAYFGLGVVLAKFGPVAAFLSGLSVLLVIVAALYVRR